MFSWLRSSASSSSSSPPQPSAATANGRRGTSTARGLVVLSEQWDVLGPFQIEAAWGADPLEKYGAFRNLSPGKEQHYHSSLSVGGTVNWSRQSILVHEQHETACEVRGSFEFPQVDWHGLQSVSGWSALQYQGWARTELHCNSPTIQRVAVYTDNILEFWIDEEHFFGGDFFAFRKAPVIVSLRPGRHQLNVRLVRDVRSMGGVGPPVHPLAIRVELCSAPLMAFASNAIMPEFVKDRGFPSRYGSVPLCNTTTESILIHSVQASEDSFDITPLSSRACTLAAGQSRPFGFHVNTKLDAPGNLHLAIAYTVGANQELQKLSVEVDVRTRNITEPIKSTFLHGEALVAYCVVSPPAETSPKANAESRQLPVLVNLHGAGIEAQNDLVRHQLDPAGPISAWTIFPEGGTPWSGDDWHTWGLTDVTAAIASLPRWIQAISWKGPGVDSSRWYVIGHSNGGQGTWCLSTHYPDMIAAAAPCSAYSSIQAYVSYNLWTEMDPRAMACIQTVLSAWRHELLLPNIAGIPILEQHGSADDNVPVSHSRRMSQLLDFLGASPRYNELAGKGHYYDGIMTTPFLRRLYQQINEDGNSMPLLPDKFRVVALHSHIMGSRGGIEVDQLETSTRLGYIDVEQQVLQPYWKLQTSNIRRFHFSPKAPARTQQSVMIDGAIFSNILEGSHFVRDEDQSWHNTKDDDWRNNERNGRQRGSMEAILNTNDAFLIRTSVSCLFIALQISRTLFQYFGADSEIVSDESAHLSHRGNRVTIAMANEHGVWRPGLPISKTSDGISMETRNGDRRTFPLEEGLGVIFLAPLPGEALELCIWGHDITGLRQAAKLFPMLTGTGQPDFIVVCRECSFRGAAGVKGMGFFEHDWKVSNASYV